MLAFALGLKLICAMIGLAWAGWVLMRAPRQALYICWGIFSVSMSALLISETLGEHLGPAAPWVMMLSGGTCSVFWLFTRSLFRKDPAIGPFELALVAGIILPSLIKPILLTTGITAPIDTLVHAQTLLSSTALMLSLWEAARNWPSEAYRGERVLRYGYLSTFVPALLLCSVVLKSDVAIGPNQAALIEAFCASGVVTLSSIALLYRLRHGMPDMRPALKSTSGDVALGQRLMQLIEREQLYLDPDLNLAQLARALGETPNKVSRAITAGLKAANINQLINARRINHAQSLLHDPTKDELSILQIALESGFNSIGPFNRAFKAQTALTPREYRRQRGGNMDGLAAE